MADPRAAGRKAWRKYVSDGIPSSGVNDPTKDEIIEFVDEVSDAIDAIDLLANETAEIVASIEDTADSIIKALWSELLAITGTRDGQRGVVTGPDDTDYDSGGAGTHSDPVTSGTVANVGTYGWSTAEAGWQWLTTAIDEQVYDLLDVVSPEEDAGDGYLMRIEDEEGKSAFGVHRDLGVDTPYAWLRPTLDGFFECVTADEKVHFLIDEEGVKDGNTKRINKLFTPGTVEQVAMGIPRPDGVGILVDIEGSHLSQAQIEIARDPGMIDVVWRSGASMPVATAKSPASYYRTAKWHAYDAERFDPNTRYWVTPYVDGVRDASKTMTFMTLPEDGVATAYSFWAISCSRGTLSAALGVGYMPMLDYIAATALTTDARFTVHMGDIAYPDINANDIYRFRTRIHREFRGYQSGAVFSLSMPYIHTPDDHETPGEENSVWESEMGDGSSRPDALIAWRGALREQHFYYPSPQIADGETDPDKVLLTQVWPAGKVKNIMPDCPSQRTLLGDTPTMLGTGTNPAGSWNQLQRAKDELTAAEGEGYQLVFLFLGPTVATGSVGGSFGAWFTEERAELYDHILDLPIAVAIVHGDLHASFADDGKLTAYDTDGLAGIPLFSSSAILSGTSGSPGTKEWLGVDSAFEGTQFAMLFDVLASGGNITGYTVRLYGEPIEDEVPTLLGTYSTDDADWDIAFQSSSVDLTAGAPFSIPVEKFGVGIDSCSATWSMSGGGPSGTVEFGPNRRIRNITGTAPAAGTYTIALSAPVGAELGAQFEITLNVT